MTLDTGFVGGALPPAEYPCVVLDEAPAPFFVCVRSPTSAASVVAANGNLSIEFPLATGEVGSVPPETYPNDPSE